MFQRSFVICVVFSVWTIIQTSLHLAFVIYTYYMGICQITPTQDTTILFYLTYLYNKNCAPPKLENILPLSLETIEAYVLNIVKTSDSEKSSVNMEQVVKELLDKLEFFPDYATASSRTSVFLLGFIILDGAWIISAVALLMGTCFQLKQSLALVYYGPWLMLTVCVSIFDAAATILFALDIPETTNFANWLKFVGIAETSEFEDFDAKDPSTLIPLAPSIAICSVTARFILGWISNWIGFIFVLKATVSAYRESYKSQPRMRHNPHHPSPMRSQIDLDTSAARIRSWQMFYGAIETTSSQDSKSPTSERDLNSNHSKDGKNVRVEFQNEVAAEVPSVSGNISTYYHAYPDVAESIDGAGGVCLDELRSQLPWSYIVTQYEPKERVEEERIELESRPKRLYRLKSDSSTSGTEM